MNTNNMTILIKNKYMVLEHIGKGKFGNIYKGVYKKNNETVAIKMEDINTHLLKHETTILKYLREQGCKYVPDVYWYGIEIGKRMLVISYYDMSLSQYYVQQQTQDGTPTFILDKIMSSCISILEDVHKKFVLHRDIKPDNFMVNSNSSNIYLIDFGLSTFYIDDKRQHVLDNGSHSTMIGNHRFASYNIYSGYAPSRRDDLISIGYMYMYYYNYNNSYKLPWDNLSIDNKSLSGDIMNIFSLENRERCRLKSWDYFGEKIKNLNNNKIYNYLKYCYSLSYSETPDYNSLIWLFT